MPDFEPPLPANLLPQAVRDIVRILRESRREYGSIVARHSRDRLYARCNAIQMGLEKGHMRQDVRPRRPIRFANEAPWVIVFDPYSRNVYRVLHGKRDFPSLFSRS